MVDFKDYNIYLKMIHDGKGTYYVAESYNEFGSYLNTFEGYVSGSDVTTNELKIATIIAMDARTYVRKDKISSVVIKSDNSYIVYGSMDIKTIIGTNDSWVSLNKLLDGTVLFDYVDSSDDKFAKVERLCEDLVERKSFQNGIKD